MTDFLLIHGPGHGSWAWDGVKGTLEDRLRRLPGLYHSSYSAGSIIAPDLPGHGSRYSQDNPRHLSFEHCVDELQEFVNTSCMSEPVVVAHSLSGLIALELVRRLGNAKALVLIGAAVPDIFHNALETLPIPTRALIHALRLYPNTPPESVRLIKEFALLFLCNDMPFPEAASTVISKLRPIPLRLWDSLPNPIALEPACPTTYMLLKRDRFLWPSAQRKMAASLPNAELVEIDCGHEATISHSREIANVLLQYA